MTELLQRLKSKSSAGLVLASLISLFSATIVFAGEAANKKSGIYPFNCVADQYHPCPDVIDLKDMIIDKDTYLPKGVLHIDLDRGFKEFVTNQLGISLDGKKVPVLMMGIQTWNEFTQTWKFSDEYKNVKIPFVNIVRNPDTKPGTNPSLIYNIPVGRHYTYAEVPTWDGNKRGVDIYQIPQPIPVDITYDVRIFAYRQQELNKFNLTVLKNFQSRQAYTVVNGHYIPIVLEDTSDESQITDLDSKRFYVQMYSFNLQGFILDPEEFIVTPAISRTFTITENI